ncbi:hypothetical protein RirG_058630 [Rhizophagus irregularis DAOM 197198w]|uniref:Uncharacterized protein n=1 Tax=Rhizophagus irregularis (strain DAOM 197198w) TaxID=1432141 RepID=A0A015L1F2_RHIIW|nr:hypothetical protein RirG_058630 [Rhizophagus irregularis DAOM 197198w]
MIKKFKYKFRNPFDSKTSSQNLWKGYNDEYQVHVTTSHTESEDISELCEKMVYMENLEKRREVYGICGECNELGTGKEWCQSCNAKRFKENFENWTSENKNIDELIQQSQLNAVLYIIQNVLNGYLMKILKMLIILPKEVLVAFIRLTGLDTFAIGISKIKIGRGFLKRLH